MGKRLPIYTQADPLALLELHPAFPPNQRLLCGGVAPAHDGMMIRPALDDALMPH